MNTRQTFDLESSLGREAFAKKLVADIDTVCVKLYEDGFRSHLGASVIGGECNMRLWLDFHWTHKETYVNKRGENHHGRMMRLFQRGHREEAVWIKHLRELGWTISDIDPETGKQIRLHGSEGHFGGSLDAEGTHPDFPGMIFLFEFKTYNEKSYNTLLKEGVQQKSPEHWGQMCVYGRRRKIQYAIYCPINKNDDSIHGLQVVKLDWDLALHLEAKANYIISTKQPPERISENPSYWKCEYCHQAGVCHRGEPVEINCRSCRYGEPAQNAEWICTNPNHSGTIPKEYIGVGCSDHFGIVVKQ